MWNGAIAALPILLVLGLMLGVGWSAARAGLAALAVCLLLALTLYDFGGREGQAFSLAQGLAGVGAEATFTALTIFWIILPALGIYQLQLRTGSLEILRQWLGCLTNDPAAMALLVAWFFALFLEGAAGFGTSAALAAPFLVGAGFDRRDAVTIVLIGHAVGVSFGAIGTPVLPQLAATEFGGRQLAVAASTYHSLLGWAMPLVIVGLVGRMKLNGGSPDAAPAVASSRWVWAWALLAGVCFLVPSWAIARHVGPELPTLGGALIGGLVFVLVLSRREHPAGTAPEGVLRAASPYLILVAIVLATRLVPGLNVMLANLEFRWELFASFRGSMAVLHHPGTLLVASFLVGARLQRCTPAEAVEVALAALKQLRPVVVPLLAMLLLARLMVHAGMIDDLAQAAAGGLGPLWPLVAPFVGVLGTFVTGSATASNILFTDFQAATAARLALDPLPLLGAQNFGAAVGNIVCPHNIVAAAATVGLIGHEGPILRRTLPACLLYTLAGGLLAWLVLV